jgi:hypothetical protein
MGMANSNGLALSNPIASASGKPYESSAASADITDFVQVFALGLSAGLKM